MYNIYVARLLFRITALLPILTYVFDAFWSKTNELCQKKSCFAPASEILIIKFDAFSG